MYACCNPFARHQQEYCQDSVQYILHWLQRQLQQMWSCWAATILDDFEHEHLALRAMKASMLTTHLFNAAEES